MKTTNENNCRVVWARNDTGRYFDHDMRLWRNNPYEVVRVIATGVNRVNADEISANLNAAHNQRCGIPAYSAYTEIESTK